MTRRQELAKQREKDRKKKQEDIRRAAKKRSNTCGKGCPKCTRKCHKNVGHIWKHNCLRDGNF